MNALKLSCLSALYPKIAVLSGTMIFAAGSAKTGSVSNMVLLGFPLAMLLLISPLFFWFGASRLRAGDAIPGLVMMAAFLIPGLVINAYWA